MSGLHKTPSGLIDAYIASLGSYIRENLSLITALSLMAIAGYGFELFNLNLTIDEEAHAFFTPEYAASLWLSQGRWGMYLLTRFFMQHAVVPFVPLFTALFFNIAAVLVLLKCWKIEGGYEKVVAGALCISYPGMAYLYSFSTINYAVGIGLFLSALSLFLFLEFSGPARYLSVVPAVFAVSIYQVFAVVLAVIFLLWLVSVQLHEDRRRNAIKDITGFLIVGLTSAALYYLIARAMLAAAGTTVVYVNDFLDFRSLAEKPLSVITPLYSMIKEVYSGSSAVYANEVRSFGIVVLLSLCSIVLSILRASVSAVSKLILFVVVAALLVLPFAPGLLSRGIIPMRSLAALPLVIGGIAALGLRGSGQGFKLLMGVLTLFCVFQFMISINYLNASSHLSLQADRLVAAQLIGRIEEARVAAGLEEIKYIEVVGYRKKTPSLAMPKSDTFGASFFEWDEGYAWRVIYFLRTLGYYNTAEPMPNVRRGQVVGIVKAMPDWPSAGSVRAEGDGVIIRFGDYSRHQKDDICAAVKTPEFCK